TDFLMTSTSNVMMVQMRENLRAGNLAALRAIWLDAVRKLALALCPLVGVLVVLAQELIVLLFTDAYARSVPVFIVWTLGMLLTILLTDSVLRVYAQNRFLILQNCLRLTLVVLLIPSFLQHFGLVGAVLVTLVATLCARVFALARVKTLLEFDLAHLLPWTSLARILALSALAAAPVQLLKSLLPLAHLPQLLLGGTVYVLTYYALLLWIGPLHPDEKQQLRRWPRMPVLRLRKALGV